MGGQPGQLPTVMVGSIFYHGHKIVKDFKRGIFDKKMAEDLLNQEEEISRKTGNPRMVDVYGNSPESVVKFINFVAEKTESPLLLDVVNLDAQLVALKHVGETGLSDRVVYNSINPLTKPEELEAIKVAEVKSAIILLFNQRRPTIEGRMQLLESNTEKNLLKASKTAGIDKPLIDTTVIDMPDPGPSAKAIHLIKDKYGFPCGCGPHNAINMWDKQRKIDPKIKMIGSAVACVTPILMGANFILYGPISRAKETYYACGIVDSYIAYSMRQYYKIKPMNNEHPLFNIYK